MVRRVQIKLFNLEIFEFFSEKNATITVVVLIILTSKYSRSLPLNVLDYSRSNSTVYSVT